MVGAVEISNSVIPSLAMTRKESLIFANPLKIRAKIQSSEMGEFLDFGGSGWLDRPRSGGAALAPCSV
jgi:hypothetical protein